MQGSVIVNAVSASLLLTGIVVVDAKVMDSHVDYRSWVTTTYLHSSVSVQSYRV